MSWGIYNKVGRGVKKVGPLAPRVTRIAPAWAVGVPEMANNLGPPNNDVIHMVRRNGHGIRHIY